MNLNIRIFKDKSFIQYIVMIFGNDSAKDILGTLLTSMVVTIKVLFCKFSTIWV